MVFQESYGESIGWLVEYRQWKFWSGAFSSQGWGQGLLWVPREVEKGHPDCSLIFTCVQWDFCLCSSLWLWFCLLSLSLPGASMCLPIWLPVLVSAEAWVHASPDHTYQSSVSIQSSVLEGKFALSFSPQARCVHCCPLGKIFCYSCRKLAR